jgi:hypothetical protein
MEDQVRATLLAAAVEMTKGAGMAYDHENAGSHAAVAMEVRKNYLLLRHMLYNAKDLTEAQVEELLQKMPVSGGSDDDLIPLTINTR